MKEIPFKLFFIIVFLINISDGAAQVKSQSQTKPNYSAAFNNWFFLHPQLKLAPKWKVAAELHLRRDNWVLNHKNLLIRPYLSYKVNDMIALSIGYSYIRSWPTGPSYGPGPSNEHNVWEQLLVTQKFGANKKVKLQHRYRLEHRFRDHWDYNGLDFNKKGLDFSNRFRYRISLNTPIVELPKQQKIYVHFFDEIWINQYDYLLFRSIARNWIYGGLGWKFNSKGALELGYMHQWDIKSSTNLHTHILQLSLAYTWELRQKKNKAI